MKDNIQGFIGYHDLEDLKKLRKVVRKAIREYENN